MKYYSCLILLLLLYSCNSSKNYIGYTNGFQDGQYGVSTFSLNSHTGDIKEIAFIKSLYPHYMTISNDNKNLYITGYKKKNKKRKKFFIASLTIKDVIPTTNDIINLSLAVPSHLSLGKEEKYLAITGSNNGIFTTWKINPDKTIQEKPISNIKTIRSSSNKNSQRKSYPHSSFFSKDNKFVLVNDLGTDKVHTYAFYNGELTRKYIYTTTLGGGPRHLTFDKKNNYVYILNELSSQIEVCSFDKKNGKLTKKQVISTIPKEFTKKNTTAEILIHPNGKFLYSSNRGHNSIALFSISPKSGKLTFIKYQNIFGNTPRNFNITADGKMMLVGNRYAKQLVSLSINESTGELTFKKINKWNSEIMRVLFQK